MSSELYSEALDGILHSFAMSANDSSVDNSSGLWQVGDVFAAPLLEQFELCRQRKCSRHDYFHWVVLQKHRRKYEEVRKLGGSALRKYGGANPSMTRRGNVGALQQKDKSSA